MANASEEMLSHARERGWAITASNDDDGVARVVEAVVREAQHEGNGDGVQAGLSVVEFAQ